MIAGRKIGEAFVKVRPDTTGFAREAQPGAIAAGKLSGKLFAGSFAGTFSGVLLGGLLQTAFRSVQSFARDAFAEAREAAKIGRLTEAVIKSTGAVAKVTTKHVEGLAEKLGELAGVDDDTVQAGTNLLLTFTKIRSQGGVFDEAAKAALDMTAAMHNGNVTTEGYRGTILQIGKALNDPVRGMNSLRRAGVTFTEQQKAQIKALVASGKTMEAQKIILKELAVEFGGAAAASTDDAQKAQVAWNNFKEDLGGALLPIVGKVATFFSGPVLTAIRAFVGAFKEGDVTSTGFIGKVETFGVALRGVWQVIQTRIIPALRSLAGVIAPALNWLTSSGTWAGIIRSALGGAAVAIVAITAALKVWVAVQTVLNIVLTANPIGLVIIAIAALVAGIIYAYKHSETFRKIVQGAWRGIQVVIGAVVSWVTGTVWPALQRAWDGIVLGVRLAVGFFRFYWNIAVAVVRAVVGFIVARWQQGVANIMAIVERVRAIVGVLRAAFEQARAAVVDRVLAVVAFVRGLPGRLVAALGNLASTLYQAGRDVISGLWQGISSMGGFLWEKVTGFVRNNITGPITKLLGLSSPSKLFRDYGKDTVRGFVQGLEAESGRLVAALDRLVPAPQTAATGATITNNFNLSGPDPKEIAALVSRDIAWGSGI